MGKPNIIGAGITIAAGVLSFAYVPGLAEVSISYVEGVKKAEMESRIENLRTLNPDIYSITRRGIELGMKFFYKE